MTTLEAKKRKLEMFEMSQKGATFEEIGKAYNISRQRVAQIIGGRMKPHFTPIAPNKCIYPNVRKWMNDNRISKAELTRRLYGNTGSDNQHRVRMVLLGERKDMLKSTLDKYLEVTGLTYVLFVLLASSLVCLGFEKILNIFRSDKNEK